MPSCVNTANDEQHPQHLRGDRPHNGLETVMSLHEFKHKLNELIFDRTACGCYRRLHVVKAQCHDEIECATGEAGKSGTRRPLRGPHPDGGDESSPQTKEILEAGALDAGDFILKLRDKSMEGEWYAAAYARRRLGIILTLITHRPTSHRCLSHLILLMVRTIERHGNAQDLLATKKEPRMRDRSHMDVSRGPQRSMSRARRAISQSSFNHARLYHPTGR